MKRLIKTLIQTLIQTVGFSLFILTGLAICFLVFFSAIEKGLNWLVALTFSFVGTTFYVSIVCNLFLDKIEGLIRVSRKVREYSKIHKLQDEVDRLKIKKDTKES